MISLEENILISGEIFSEIYSERYCVIGVDVKDKNFRLFFLLGNWTILR